MELILAHKETGAMWEISNCTTSVQLETHRTGSPGKFTFSFIRSDIDIAEGDIVRFTSGDTLFYGWVFTVSRNRWDVVDVTCYDRVRYLKANASYAFYGQTASDIIKRIAADLQIDIGDIAETGYQIPSLIESNKSCIDIIQDALNQTLLGTGRLYVLYDDGNGLALRYSAEWFSGYYLGDSSYLTNYSFKSDIDANTYNSIKLVQPNEETGRNDVVVVEDSDNIARWGKLQFYKSVDGAFNTAQMTDQAQQTLNYYNRVRKTLSLSALGIEGLRAGMMLQVIINKEDIDQFVLLESVTHTWTNDDHSMEVETLEL